MENKRKEVVRGNRNAYIADNTELAYSIHVVVKASSQNFNTMLAACQSLLNRTEYQIRVSVSAVLKSFFFAPETTQTWVLDVSSTSSKWILLTPSNR